MERERGRKREGEGEREREREVYFIILLKYIISIVLRERYKKRDIVIKNTESA